MINPIIFSFKLFALTVTLRWYGVLVMLGAVVGAWFAEKEIRRRGENGEVIWDAMVWVLPIGIVGARLWYIVNSILGGSTYSIDNPVKVFCIWEGGLHIFRGFLLGLITSYIFLKKNGLDTWLFLDAIAPATLLGQALARPANYINQELYGPPTKLSWGILIDTQHRLPQYSDLSRFPETTRFHPTFLYGMVLNILIVLFLWWLSRRYEDELKTGAQFSAWLILAGLSRTFIEFFRPDQPRIGDSFVSYTMLIAFLMAVTGAVMLLARYGKLQLAAAEGWEEEYQVKKVEQKQRSRTSTVSGIVSVNKKVESKKLASSTSISAKTKAATGKASAQKTAKKTSATQKSKTSKR